MAVDSRDKRSSAVHIYMPSRNQLPTPSGTIGASQRAQAALMYSGLFGSTPITSTDELTRPMIVHGGRTMGWP